MVWSVGFDIFFLCGCVIIKTIKSRINGKKELLKQLIKKDKNDKESVITHHNQKTYAEIATSKLVVKNKRIPKIIVKNLKKDSENQQDFKKKVCDILIREKEIHMKQIKIVKDTEIAIKTMNEKSAKATIELLSKELSSNYKRLLKIFNL